MILSASKKVKNQYSKLVIIIIPLSLSAFTHLWNLDGFPSIYRDEDHYLRKTMHVLRGLGPQEGPKELLSYPLTPYAHPYFGQFFLAGILGIIGYPDSLHTTTDVSSIKEIFIIPRMLMGILAIFDTFLIFKIAERRYNTTVGLIASVLFAVMPLTWIMRRIWLEPIQLPFLLGSILLALYAADLNLNQKRKIITIALISGTFLGLAIFTKIPVMAMIPLVGFILYSKTRNFKILGLWLAPVLLIPLIWPLYALSQGEFNEWVSSVLWQAERQNSGLFTAIGKLFDIDPVLVVLSFVGFVYAIVRRRDLFLILWFVPFLAINFLSGYTFYWHLIPIFPAFCISFAILIADITKIFRSNTIKKLLPYTVLSILAIFGLVVTTMLIGLNLTSFHYEVISVLGNEIQKANKVKNPDSFHDNGINEIQKVTVLGNNYFLWFPKYIFDINGTNDYKNYYHYGDIKTKKVILLVGANFIDEMTRYNDTNANVGGVGELLFNSNLITTVVENQSAIPRPNTYPFSSLVDLDPWAPSKFDIRSNY